MSSWLHRTDKTFLERVSPSDMKLRFPAFIFVDESGNAQGNGAWLLTPDLAAVAGFEPKHWNIVGDVVLLMTQAERDAVDAQITSDALTADRETEKGRYDIEKVLKALVLVLLDEINTLRQFHVLSDRTAAQARAAIRSKVDTL